MKILSCIIVSVGADRELSSKVNRRLDASSYTAANFCPIPLSDYASCITAGLLLGMPFNAATAATSAYPNGCYRRSDTAGLTISSTLYAVSILYAACSPDYGCLCKDVASGSYSSIFSSYCNSSLSANSQDMLTTLSTVTLCSAAATSGGYTFIPITYNYDDIPSGCIIDGATNNVFFNARMLGSFYTDLSNALVSQPLNYMICHADSSYSRLAGSAR